LAAPAPALSRRRLFASRRPPPPPASSPMEDRKAVIKSADMADDMQADAVECAATVRAWRGWGMGEGVATSRVLLAPSAPMSRDRGGGRWGPAPCPRPQTPRRRPSSFFVSPLLPLLSRPSTSTPWRRTSPPTSSASSTSGTRPRGTASSGATLVRGGEAGGRARARSGGGARRPFFSSLPRLVRHPRGQAFHLFLRGPLCGAPVQVGVREREREGGRARAFRGGARGTARGRQPHPPTSPLCKPRDRRSSQGDK
jgi:hypothetical protein